MKLFFFVALLLAGCSDKGGPGGAGGGGFRLGGNNAIFPLAVGRSWQYEISGSTYPNCPNGKKTTEIKTQAAQIGKNAFLFPGYCNIDSWLTVDGDTVDSLYQGVWYRMTEGPIEAGHTWMGFRAEAHWEKIGSYTTPAGTFNDCWKAVRHVAYTDYAIYCRGVGPVENFIRDLAGGGFKVVLTGKNF